MTVLVPVQGSSERSVVCARLQPDPVASWTKEWREKTPGELEGQAESIANGICGKVRGIVALIDEGQRLAALEQQRWQEERREWEGLQERRKREEEERRRAEAAERSRRDLLAIIEEWSLAKRIENFFREVELRAGESPEGSELLERLRHGREVLGSLEALDQFRTWKTPEEQESS
jgi:hypothetical protein